MEQLFNPGNQQSRYWAAQFLHLHTSYASPPAKLNCSSWFSKSESSVMQKELPNRWWRMLSGRASLHLQVNCRPPGPIDRCTEEKCFELKLNYLEKKMQSVRKTGDFRKCALCPQHLLRKISACLWKRIWNLDLYLFGHGPKWLVSSSVCALCSSEVSEAGCLQ